MFQSTKKDHHNNKGELIKFTREQLKEACDANPEIVSLIERNVKILKGIDRQITSDFARKFVTRISIGAQSFADNQRDKTIEE